MKKCGVCSKTSDDNSLFCSACGSPKLLYICANCGSCFADAFCPDCGTRAGDKGKVCQKCGRNYFTSFCPQCGIEGKTETAAATQQNIVPPAYADNMPSSLPQMVAAQGTPLQQVYSADARYTEQYPYQTVQTYAGKMKNKWIAFFLCLFLGEFGAHKFYEGKFGIGVLYFFTMGLFGLGWLADTIKLLFKSNPYYLN